MSDRIELTNRLAELGFDGPRVLGGDIFGSTGAICLRCGALVLLGDAEEQADGRMTERSIRLHVEWHSILTDR